jgi:microcystin degradation protein MlrC
VTSKTSPRIAVGGFMHETNTFAPVLADYDAFAHAGDRPPLTRGEAVLTAFAGMNTAIEGALQVLRAHGATILPLVWTSSTPSGYVTEDAYERIVGMLIDDLKAQLPYDAVYLSLHGAMVAQHLEDGEGELLRRVREVVGDAIPVVASLDLHCNTTPEMAARATGLVAYRTYPHVDMADTGTRAARLLCDVLAGGRTLHTAYRQIPYIIPLTWQCTLIEPSKSIYAAMAAMEGGDLASASFTPGFPASDIRNCGPAVMAYGWTQEAADKAADALRDQVLAHEADYNGHLYAPDEAVQEAMTRAKGATQPILLADTQDNPGAGGTGDTVGLLAALLRHQPEGAVLGVLLDTEAAAKAHAAGVGSEITVGLGAKSGMAGESPVQATCIVERLGDGEFVCTGPMMGGARMRLGPMALLRAGNVQIVVSSRVMQALDQAPFHHVGIEPAETSILALKSSVHFRADFEPIAADVLVVEAPGQMVADPSKLPFTRLRPDVRVRPQGPTFAEWRSAAQ